MAQNDADQKFARIARQLAEEPDYADMLEDEHGAPVWESDTLIIFSDEHGHELNEIADDYDVDRSELSEWMHSTARKHYGREQATGSGDPWSASDPIVLLYGEL